MFRSTTESHTSERPALFYLSSEIPTNMSLSPPRPCLNNDSPTMMKWEQSKMLFPMCFTFLLTIAAALSAAHYSPYSGGKRSAEAASNTTSHTAFLRGISLTMAEAL